MTTELKNEMKRIARTQSPVKLRRVKPVVLKDLRELNRLAAAFAAFDVCSLCKVDHPITEKCENRK